MDAVDVELLDAAAAGVVAVTVVVVAEEVVVVVVVVAGDDTFATETDLAGIDGEEEEEISPLVSMTFCDSWAPLSTFIALSSVVPPGDTGAAGVVAGDVAAAFCGFPKNENKFVFCTDAAGCFLPDIFILVGGS